ncbi:MAG: T9SS type A sorting domain-containing protein [Bacteroidia bacterium]|nr:T9SS type A sorting domain-containing protein [Bacteroidia bacterium]
MYLLPQNKAGKLEIFDINGRAVYSQNLPQWSTLQFISLPKIANGIYAIKINSNISITKNSSFIMNNFKPNDNNITIQREATLNDNLNEAELQNDYVVNGELPEQTTS